MRKVFVILSLLIAFRSVSFSQSTDYGYPIQPDLTSTSANTILPMGGAFSVGELGNATYSIPIEVPSGINEMQPSLSITYNSLGGNGICGLGFNLSGLSAISRVSGSYYYDDKTSDMVANSKYVALSMDGQRLITGSNGKYYVENDPNIDITLKNDTVTVKQNGKMLIYKKINNKYQVYYLVKATDNFNNTISYSYKTEDNYVYPSSISYGVGTGYVTISFVYETRPDGVNCFNRIPIQIKKRLSKIDVKKNAALWRSYGLTYSYSNGFSKIISINEKNSKGEQKYPTEFSWGTYSSSILNNKRKLAFSNIDNISPSELVGIPGDFNNDGIGDFILARFSSSSTLYYYTGDRDGNFKYLNSSYLPCQGSIKINKNDFIKLKSLGSFCADFDGDGFNEVLIPSTNFANLGENHFYQIIVNACKPVAQRAIQFYFDLNAAEVPAITCADFNNDGRAVVMLVEKQAVSGNKYTFQSKSYGTPDKPVIINYQLTLQGNPDKILCGDFDGDGLIDMLAVAKNASTVFWNRGTRSGSIFSDASKTVIPQIKNSCTAISVGDFNGDGVADVVYNTPNDRALYILKNSGQRQFSSSVAVSLPDAWDLSDTDKDDENFIIEVVDFNCDGKSDLLVSKAMFKHPKWKNYYRFSTNYDYWLQSNGTSFTITSSKSWSEKDDNLYRWYTSGDYNGDGYQEIIRLETDNQWYIYRPFYNCTSADCYNKITRITQDNGAYTSITYSNLADNHIYKRSHLNRYPVLEQSFPLPVVSFVSQSKGIAPNESYSYIYGQLLTHVKGKGLLGFEIRNIDLKHTSQSVYTAINKWDSNYYIPTEIYCSKTNSEIINSTTTVSVATISGKRYVAYPSKTSQTDCYGKTTITTNTYNATKGYIESSKTVFPDNSYKLQKYQNYVLAGGVYRPRLVVTEQKHSDDNNTYSTQQYFEYNTNKGLVTKSIENYKTDFALTTLYKYDNYGNITEQSTFGRENDTASSIYKYDGSRRLPIEKKSKPLNTITKYTYDQFDNLTSETDATDNTTPLKTTYKYDNWGLNIETIYPDSTSQSTIRGWNGKQYFVASLGTATPWTKTTYDNAGHIVKEETIGVSSACGAQIATSEHSYGIHGKPEKTVIKTGSYEETTTNRYNSEGSLTEHTDNAHTIRYSYDSNKTAVTDNGRTTTTENDYWGNIKKVTSPDGSTVNYKYFSNGKPKTITSLGSTVSLQYYPNGLKKSITDSDAGTESYVYDSFGNVIQQKRGDITTTNTYSKGLLTRSKCGDITTTYTYDKRHRLSKLHNGTSSIAYAYDKYGRTTKETYTIDNKEFTYLYTYDVNGKLAAKTFPDKSEEKYTYNKYGVVTSTSIPYVCTWTLYNDNYEKGGRRSTEITGAVFKYLSLNTDNTISRISYSSPNGGSGSDSYDYTYDRFQNLTTRKGQYTGTETFEYDESDRLTQIGSDYEYQYAPNGNILYQTGVGEYEYKGSQPHAISAIDNDNGVVKSLFLTTTNTPFRKPKTITDNHNPDSIKTYHIYYSPDNERIKSVYTCNKENVTTYYLPDYEVEIANGVTTTRHYIFSSATGHLVAVNFKQGDKSETYFAETDHLGSVLKLVDSKVHSKYEARYTPFGVRRIVKNDLGYNFPRGYTMHEHLDQFGVINANARLYDPYLARFLSPDPYIQEPTNPQNFNRFSYCLNNPLKYSDPSGEFWWGWLPYAIGAVVGGFQGYHIGESAGLNGWGRFATTFMGAGIGAASAGFGSYVSSSAGVMANTLSVVGGSYYNSIGMSILGGFCGQNIPLCISFGAGSLTFGENGIELGYLGKKGNQWYENLGYGLGAMASVSDFLVGLKKENIGSAKLETEKLIGQKDKVGHAQITSPEGESLIDFGPNSNRNIFKFEQGTNHWVSEASGGFYQTVAENQMTNKFSNDNLFVRNINYARINKISAKLDSNPGFYNVFFRSCSQVAARTFTASGMPMIGFHPYILRWQIFLLNQNLKPWLICNYLHTF